MQLTEFVAPIPAMYVPAAQSRQVFMLEAPDVALYLPAGHSKHVEEEFAPAVGLYLPLEQRIHVEMPIALMVVLKVPAGQSWQDVAPPVPYAPAAQGRQEAGAAAKVPAGQVALL